MNERFDLLDAAFLLVIIALIVKLILSSIWGCTG